VVDPKTGERKETIGLVGSELSKQADDPKTGVRPQHAPLISSYTKGVPSYVYGTCQEAGHRDRGCGTKVAKIISQREFFMIIIAG